MSYRATRRREIRKFIATLKECTPCSDCNKYFPAEVIDYDHIGKQPKKDGVARMVSNATSLKIILKEIAKCEAVCANCHRLRTAQRKLKKSE